MTASRGRGGPYLRIRSIPTKVVSEFTTEVRNIMTACSRAWGALDPEEQVSWNTWCGTHPITDALGDSRTLFGAQGYTQLNARILKAGDSVIELPPVSAAPAPMTAFSAAPEEATQTCVMTYLPTPLAATERIWITAAIVTNPGVAYYANLMKNVHIGALASASLVDIGPDLVARFGSLIEGQVLHINAQVYEKTSGMLSGGIYQRIAVIA